MRILDSLKANPFQSCQDLAGRLHLRVSYQTVYRYLIQAKFVRRKPINNLELDGYHIEQRLDWCEMMKYFKYFDYVVWSDEAFIWLNVKNIKVGFIQTLRIN